MSKIQKLILSEKDLLIFVKKMKRNGALAEGRSEQSVINWARVAGGAICSVKKYRYTKRIHFKFKKMLSDDYYVEIKTQLK